MRCLHSCACLHTPHCQLALVVCSYLYLSRPCCCVHSCTLTYCCMSGRAPQSLYTLKSLFSRAQPIHYHDRSAHNGRSACRPITEFASPPFSSNAVLHRRRLRNMICFCVPFFSLSLFLAVIRLFRDSYVSYHPPNSFCIGAFLMVFAIRAVLDCHGHHG